MNILSTDATKINTTGSEQDERAVDEARAACLGGCRRFVFRKVDSGTYETTVEINLEPHESGTVVRLVEHGYEDGSTGTDDMLKRASGWGHTLTLMKFYVEHGVTY